MTQLLDLHPLQTRVADFIEGLQSLEEDRITSERVLEFLGQTRLRADALTPYIRWNPQSYARNLIYRDDFFEVLALCWLPGQRTPVHSHNGQLGWVTVVQGELVCRDYRFIRAQQENDSTLVTADCGSRRVDVELLGSATCQADGSVAVVDRRRTTHQIENLETSLHGSVSLHVYSKPIDSCVLFDEPTRCWERRRLQYYSSDGSLPRNSRLREARQLATLRSAKHSEGA